jgi:hypothetical protein
MLRTRMYDLRVSRLPRVNGLCADNLPAISDIINAAQSRLIHAPESGDEGWWGSYAQVAFDITRANPYITLPRDIARLEGVAVCDKPIPVNSEFIEYLVFGTGRLRRDRCCGPTTLQVVSRNNAVLHRDLTSPPQLIRIYLSDVRDIAKRALIQGRDSNDNVVYSTDVSIEVNGIFLALDSPFVTSTIQFNTITGIQKDQTFGKVEFYQVSPDDGTEVLLLTMEPTEQTASYRRFFFNQPPCGCCPTTNCEDGTVQVTAIAKMELLPVQVDTDYTILTGQGAIEAIILESQAIRLSESDTPAAQQMSANFHRQAIRLLCGQCSHYNSINNVAVGFFPFGSAALERVDFSMT